MRTPYIAGNWKMNLTPSEGVKFAKDLAQATKGCNAKVLVAPSFVTIPGVAEALKDTHVLVAAQNMSDNLKGAFTGEVSATMLKDLGVTNVLLGHSERRAIYGENDQFINKKVLLALAEGIDIILCIGETLEEREAGKLEEVLTTQVTQGLKGVSKEMMKHITLAYEPVWAIGTGKTATPEDADNAHAFVRGIIENLFDKTVAEETIIQYGGSVKAANVKELMAKENIDGALVGGASLSVDQFLPIVCFDK